ncbi:MAG: proline iminopeptidase-family hydrolase [Erysipelotrichaceae bacterium]|nr:proline iminopeptidase-family hydrolase [Erysipelotrichaceae bacterium]
MQVREGMMPFKGYQTYYRIVGEKKEGRAPLLLLHGGPGSTHNYMELLDPLGEEREVISYDQLGCGNSYVEGHPELWKKETWQEELLALIDHLGLKEFHLLGQSWGGMLAISTLIDRKLTGVCSLILSSTLSSASLWAFEQHRMIKEMSERDQKAIAYAETHNDYDCPPYREANERYMEKHCASAPKDSDPECLRRKKRSGTESYITAWGPNEYTPNGTLKDYEYTDRLGEIGVPSLIISGSEDLCTPLIARTMEEGIPDARWELFEGCRHMCFAEDTPRYLALLMEWLERHDPSRV